MNKLWYYASGNDRKGPVSEADLIELCRQGIIHADDLVWTEGMGDWAALRTTELSQLVAAAPAAADLTDTTPAGGSPLHVMPASAPVYSSLASGADPAAQSPLSPVPEGITGWMKFNGIMMIIQGALSCLGCITIIIGVPMIIAGVALFGGAGIIENLGGVSSGSVPLFQKLKTFNLAFGIYHIIAVVCVILYILFIIFFMGTAMSQLGNFRP